MKLNFLNKKLLGWQWLILSRERVARIIVGLLLMASGYALFNGFTEADTRQRETAASLQYQTELFEATRLKLAEYEQKPPPAETPFSIPNAAATVRNELANFKAVLPSAPAAPLAAGQSDIFPSAFYYRKYNDDSPSQATVDGKSLSNVFPSRLTANPLRLLTGRFDLAFVLIYIFPLIIIALGFSLVASEKESGMLALTLSQPISLGTFVLSKTTVRFVLLGAAAILLPLLAVVIGGLFSRFDFSLLRLAVWFLAAVAYAGFWFALSMLVNFRGNSSARNALTLAACWLGIVILIPILAGLAARVIFPVPSSIVIADRERAIRTHAQQETSKTYDLIGATFRNRFPPQPGEKAASPRLNQLRSAENLGVPDDEFLQNYFRRYPQWAENTKYSQLIYATQQAREEEIEANLFPLFETAEIQRKRQESVVNAVGVISPAILLQKITSEAAGTGAARHEHFVRQFDDYVRQRNEFFSNKVFQGQTIAAVEINDIPKFIYREETSAEVVGRVALPFFILLALPLALFYLAVNIYRKHIIDA